MNVNDELKQEVFGIVEKIVELDEVVDVILDPENHQITADIYLNDVPMACVRVAPTDTFVDGERLVAHPDYLDLFEDDNPELLETNRHLTDVRVEHFYSDDPVMGEADTYLSLITDEYDG